MKIDIPCLTCFFSENNQDRSLGSPKPTSSRPIGDTSIYNTTCDNGHTSRTILLNHKFEILFESGIKALVDGYHREAVTSFAVALERFYEFSIIFFLVDKFLDEQGRFVDHETLKKFEKLWRSTLSFSERQFGAFISLYFSEFLADPAVPESSSFRNKVIHAGYVPTYKEALEFGVAVHKFIDKLLRFYNEKDANKPHHRLTKVSGLSTAFSLIKLNLSITYGPTMRANTFIRADDPQYFEVHQTLTDYISTLG